MRKEGSGQLMITVIRMSEAAGLKFLRKSNQVFADWKPPPQVPHAAYLLVTSQLLLSDGPTNTQGRCSVFTTCCVTLLLRLGPTGRRSLRLNPGGALIVSQSL